MDEILVAYALGMMAGFAIGWTVRHVEEVLRARWR